MLRRSEAEAAQLVRHLPVADQQRLRTLALCLGAAARRGLLPPLPPDITRLLLEATVQQRQQEVRDAQTQTEAHQQAARLRSMLRCAKNSLGDALPRALRACWETLRH